MIGENRRVAGLDHRRATASGRLAARCFLPVALAFGLMLGLSCGGGAPTAPTGPAPVPPGGPTPTPPTPPTPPLPPLIGNPCPGVVVRGEAPTTAGTVSAVTLIIEWENGSGGSFDWSGPYHDDDENPENRSRSPLLEVNVAEVADRDHGDGDPTRASARMAGVSVDRSAFPLRGRRLRPPGPRLRPGRLSVAAVAWAGRTARAAAQAVEAGAGAWPSRCLPPFPWCR